MHGSMVLCKYVHEIVFGSSRSQVVYINALLVRKAPVEQIFRILFSQAVRDSTLACTFV